MISSSHIFLFFFLDFYIIILAIWEAKALTFKLFFNHFFELICFLFFIFIKFETCSLDITVTNFTSLTFFDFGEESLT